MSSLPEYLTDQTEEVIRQRIFSKLPANLDKSEGSFIWDILSPVIIELNISAIWAQQVLERGFAQTTFGPYLDLRAAEHGVTRRPAVKATGRVIFTGNPGTVIPVGTQVSTIGSRTASVVVFITTKEAQIGESGTVSVDIEALEPGTSGNVGAGMIVGIPVSIAGITSVINEEPTTGGVGAESDESLLQRLLERARLPATSGNAAHYMLWARDVPGVGKVKVFPLHDGPGTVKVVVVDVNSQPVSPELLQAVYEHIEQNRPIGAAVTVEPAPAVTINVTAKVVLSAGYTLQEVQTEFNKRLAQYFAEIALAQTYVSYANVGSILFNTPGVTDYTNLLLNGGTNNIDLGVDGVPVVGPPGLTV